MFKEQNMYSKRKHRIAPGFFFAAKIFCHNRQTKEQIMLMTNCTVATLQKNNGQHKIAEGFLYAVF